MSRKYFHSGVSFYKSEKFNEALEELDKAVSTSSQPNYQVLDTRAAVYTKLGRSKDALKDAKATIEAAPEKWQGYARAARLFLASRKIDASNTMIKLALEKLKDEDAARRSSLLTLQTEIEAAARQADDRRRRYTNHSANLPLEIFGEVIATVIQDNRNAFITMSHVCKAWRSAIHNMPLLWDTLVLTGRHTKRKAALWLDMSHGNIHELDIREDATLIPEFPAVCLKGLKWEGLRVFKTERWDPQDYLISIGRPNGLDKINHLDVAFWQSVDFPIRAESFRHLTNLSLRTFTLPVAILQEMASTVTDLKSLTLRNVCCDRPFDGMRGFIDLFIANPSLENIYIENTMIGMGPLEAEVQWDHVTSLTLINVKTTFLNARLPGLRVLHAENGLLGLQPFLCKLASALPMTPSLITSLVLRSYPVSSLLVVEILQHLHELQKLEISNVSNMADRVTEALAASYVAKPTDIPAGPLICPKLVDVNFSGCSDLMTGPVVRMVRSRLPSSNSPETVAGQSNSVATPAVVVDRIRSLKIDECAKFDPDWLGWLRNNVEQVSCVYMKKKTRFRAL